MPKKFSVSPFFSIKSLRMFFHTCKKEAYRLHKSIIVHYRIPLLTVKPHVRISVMLCQNYDIRIDFFNFFPELCPKPVIKLFGVSEVCGNIKSPTVYIIRRTDPLSSYSKYLVNKFITILIKKLR